MTLESKIQTDVLEGARAMGCLAQKVVIAGRRGGHDVLVVVPAALARVRYIEHLWLELKQPGGPKSKQQSEFHELMRIAGAHQRTSDNVEDALSWIRSFKRSSTTE